MQNQLFLWYLENPKAPMYVGELNLVLNGHGVSLRYDPNWIKTGFALSEDVPLQAEHEFMPTDKDTAVGAVDDAKPDRWGERVIRLLYPSSRLSILEYLYYAGDDRFGALGVSSSPNHYQPH